MFGPVGMRGIAIARRYRLCLPPCAAVQENYHAMTTCNGHSALVAGTAGMRSNYTAMCISQRSKATYVSRSALSKRAGRMKESRKAYNYLTSARLVTSAKRTPDRLARQRDDKGLARRNHYKEQLLRGIEEKVYFLPPFLKKHIFFPTQVRSNRTLLFSGHRDLGVQLGTRVKCFIVNELKKATNRSFLSKKMEELKLEVPTAEEFARYSDAKTGDINIGMLYSPSMEAYLVATCRDLKGDSTAASRAHSIRAVRAYIARNMRDPTKVMPLEEWARAQGPLTTDSLVRSISKNANFRMKMRAVKAEVSMWGKSQVATALSLMSEEEQLALMTDVAQNADRYVAELEAQHLFRAKFMTVACSLDEMKAIMTQKEVFKAKRVREYVIQHNGIYYPMIQGDKQAYRELSSEELLQLCAFGIRHERNPTTGQKLFLRYCVRDYGLSLSESARRYGQLSDLQRAALCFPFYLSIGQHSAGVTGYRRFYREMCGRYGLVYSSGPLLGSRVFEAAMRKRWKELPEHERQRYESGETFSGVFPLVRPSAHTPAAAAPSEGPAMAEYFAENASAGAHQPSSSASVDELLSRVSAASSEGSAERQAGSTVLLDSEMAREQAGTKTEAVTMVSSRKRNASTATSAPRRGGKHAQSGDGDNEGLQVIMM